MIAHSQGWRWGLFAFRTHTCKKHLKIWNEMTCLDKGILINKEYSGALMKELKLEALIFQSTDNETIISPCTKCLYFRERHIIWGYVCQVCVCTGLCSDLIQGSLKTYKHENQWMKRWSAYPKRLVIAEFAEFKNLNIIILKTWINRY